MRRAPIERVSVRCNCRNDGTWMKLVDPGPQPPPFEVEYSELESDKPKPEHQSEEVSSNADAASESIAETQAAPVAGEASVTESAKAADESVETPNSASADGQDYVAAENAVAAQNTAGGDAFGAGVDVGDDDSKSAADEEPQSADLSTQQGADGAKVSESGETASGEQKRGKRPNRRRRSRRGQKKNDGSPPQSGS
jgi:hypothetical protein